MGHGVPKTLVIKNHAPNEAETDEAGMKIAVIHTMRSNGLLPTREERDSQRIEAQTPPDGARVYLATEKRDWEVSLDRISAADEVVGGHVRGRLEPRHDVPLVSSPAFTVELRSLPSGI